MFNPFKKKNKNHKCYECGVCNTRLNLENYRLRVRNLSGTEFRTAIQGNSFAYVLAPEQSILELEGYSKKYGWIMLGSIEVPMGSLIEFRAMPKKQTSKDVEKHFKRFKKETKK